LATFFYFCYDLECHLALTPLGLDLDAAGNRLFLQQQAQRIPVLNRDSNKGSIKSNEALDLGHNGDKAASDGMQAKWCHICTFPIGTIQPDGELTRSSSEPYIKAIGVGNSSGTGLVKRQSNDRAVALSKYMQCGSSVVQVGGYKLDTNDTTAQSNDELDKDAHSCSNQVIDLDSKKLSCNIGTTLEPEELESATADGSGHFQGLMEAVAPCLGKGVTPYLTPHKPGESVLETKEGLMEFGLNVALEKEQGINRLAGRRKRRILKLAETAIAVDNHTREPQGHLCNCRDGGEHCSRQCLQMFILEKPDAVPLTTTQLGRQKTSFGASLGQEALTGIGLNNNFNNEELSIDVTTIASGGIGLNKGYEVELPKDVSTDSLEKQNQSGISVNNPLGSSASSVGLKKLSEETAPGARLKENSSETLSIRLVVQTNNAIYS
jgi:hypothetical protein